LLWAQIKELRRIALLVFTLVQAVAFASTNDLAPISSSA